MRRKLKPGGHIYLHNEPDDAEFLAGTQSMLATLNPLHLQAFDDLSLVRVLAANGFETMFLKHQRNETLFCVARMQEPTRVAMTADERAARLGAYRKAFDWAVLQGRRTRPRAAGRGVAGGRGRRRGVRGRRVRRARAPAHRRALTRQDRHWPGTPHRRAAGR